MISENYDLFDFLYALLPTELPLKDFQLELRRLYMQSTLWKERLAFLGKYPLREIPSTLVNANRMYRRLKRAHLDYV